MVADVPLWQLRWGHGRLRDLDHAGRRQNHGATKRGPRLLGQNPGLNL
jgi:hypothetical protein